MDKNDIEFKMEETKLIQVIDIINNEIVHNTNKRKEVSKQIREYREKVLEEYREDEDKIAEYFDHERFVKEENFGFIDRRLKELVSLKDIPYFGRIDYKDIELKEDETIYIGRFGVMTERGVEPVVVDWRSPVASLFYSGKLGKESYVAPDGDIYVDIIKKRQYIIKKQELIGLFDSEIDVKDEILQMVLSSNAGEKLKDIIMSIQAEQDKIIRHPRYDVVIVDGVAGSGKTTIALHRVAYLLYNYRDVFQGKVLILGPNGIFMEYISKVLPSLGEAGVNQSTFTAFALELMDVDSIMSYKEYMEKITNNKEDFLNTSLYKTSSEYIKDLDSYINSLSEKHFDFKDIYLEDSLVITKGEIGELFNVSYKNMPLFRRNRKIKRIIFSKIKEVRDEKFKKINDEFKLASKDKDKENQLVFQRRLKIRELIEKVMELKENLKYLDGEDVEKLYIEFNGNKQLTMDDLAPILYLKLKLQGIKYPREIKHVVIDEAQDYSELQFRVIKGITGSSGFTIVGDRNQNIIRQNEMLPMSNLKEIFNESKVEEFILNKSYRSTFEIMEYSNKYLKENKVVPIVRNGTEVKEFDLIGVDKLKEKLLSSIDDLKHKGYESIGVISRNMDITEKIADLIKEAEHIKIFKQEDMAFGAGVMLLPVYFSKGLEFDAAIIIQDEELHSDKINYVMATRALHQLNVFKVSL